MEENKKRFNWQLLALVAVCVLLVISLFKLTDVSERMASLESRLSEYQNRINQLNGKIDSIYSNVDASLKKQASLLSSLSYETGELDESSHTVPVVLKVVPKTLTDDMTLSVRLGEASADFVRDGNEFTATLSVGLFVPYEQYPILSIKTASETKTELLEDVPLSALYYEYLPQLNASITPLYEFAKGKLKIDSNLQISVWSERDLSFPKIELVTEINGREIERSDVTSLANKYPEVDSDCVEYVKTYSVALGDELVIYAVAEDSFGYIHKCEAFHWEQYGDGEFEVVFDKGAQIYDKDGNLLTE